MFDIRQLIDTADLPADKKKCIGDRLEWAGVNSYEALQNAPRLVGHPVCGTVDVYQLMARLNEAHELVAAGGGLAAVLDQETVRKLIASGFRDVEAIAYAGDDQLLDVDGIGSATLKRIREAIPAAAEEDVEES